MWTLTRSTIALDDTKGFPKNTEVEAELTFTAEGPLEGEYVADVTPDPHAHDGARAALVH